MKRIKGIVGFLRWAAIFTSLVSFNYLILLKHLQVLVFEIKDVSSLNELRLIISVALALLMIQFNKSINDWLTVFTLE